MAAVQTRSADTLLSYRVDTDPDPLTVSTPTSAPPSTLIFTVTAETADVACNSITFRIPIGAGENDLAELSGPDGVDAVPVGEGASNWSAPTKTLENNGAVLAVQLKPKMAPITLPKGKQITLRVAGFTVNRVEGEVRIGLTEVTTSGTKPITLDPVFKLPPGFYLRNLTPTPLLVENGATVDLTWQSGGGDNRTKYTMFWDRESETVSGESWTSPPLHQTTGFMLQALVTTSGGKPLTHTLTTTVTVAPQDLTTRDLTVNCTLDIGNGPGTATTNLGFSTSTGENGTRHLPSAMTDGDPNTYWWSADQPKANDWVRVDLGSERDITRVRFLFGIETGQYRLPACDLEYSTDGNAWSKYTSIPNGQETYEGTTSRKARYLRLKMTAEQTWRIAIRSFDIATLPRGAVITPSRADFNTPVTIVGDLVVKGKVRFEDDVTVAKEHSLTTGDITVHSDHTLKANWINATDGTKSITVRDNVAVDTDKTLTAGGGLTVTRGYGLRTAQIGGLQENEAVTIKSPLTAEKEFEVRGNLLAKGHATITEPTKVLRVRELRGPVKQSGETQDPPIDFSNGTIKVGKIDGLISGKIENKGTWSAPYVNYKVKADGIFVGENDSGRKVYVTLKDAGGNEVIKVKLEAWEEISLPVKGGWTVYRDVEGGVSANFKVRLFTFGQ